ncbi:hypothetical protein SANA_20200 [Gottschalkiaceae bacterium SANA]|nr:hypothetical protein SANA_20200 [Gottschalkiaceae bacterium SANA]
MEKLKVFFGLLTKVDFWERFKAFYWIKKLTVTFLTAIIFLIGLSLFEFDVNASKYVLEIKNISSVKIVVFLISMSINILLLIRGEYGFEIKAVSIVEDEQSDDQVRVFKVIVDNVSSRNIYLKGFEYKYRYYSGMCCSIGEYREIEYKNEYMIDFKIDMSDKSKKSGLEIFHNPMKVFRKTNERVNSFDFTLILKYSMENLDYHPYSDWNIFYEISLIDLNDKKYKLIPPSTWFTKFNSKENKMHVKLREKYLNSDCSVFEHYDFYCDYREGNNWLQFYFNKISRKAPMKTRKLLNQSMSWFEQSIKKLLKPFPNLYTKVKNFKHIMFGK